MSRLGAPLYTSSLEDTMSTLVLRNTKGSALTFAEGDANFTNLNNDKLEDITAESIGDLSDVNITGSPSGGSVQDIDDVRNPNVITLNDPDGILAYNIRIRFTGNDVSGSNLAVGTDYWIAASIGNDQYEITDTNNGSPIALNDTGIFGDFNWEAPDVVSGAIFNGQSLVWDSANSRFNAGSASLNVFTNNVAGAGFELDNIKLKGYRETIHDNGNNDNPSLLVQNGNVQKVTITTNLNLPDFTNAQAGDSITLLVTGSGNVTGTGSYKFADGNKALISNSVVSIFYDGTTYWTSIASDFQA